MRGGVEAAHRPQVAARGRCLCPLGGAVFTGHWFSNRLFIFTNKVLIHVWGHQQHGPVHQLEYYNTQQQEHVVTSVF